MPIHVSVCIEQNMTEIVKLQGDRENHLSSSCCKLLQEIDDPSVPVLELTFHMPYRSFVSNWVVNIWEVPGRGECQDVRSPDKEKYCVRSLDQEKHCLPHALSSIDLISNSIAHATLLNML